MSSHNCGGSFQVHLFQAPSISDHLPDVAAPAKEYNPTRDDTPAKDDTPARVANPSEDSSAADPPDYIPPDVNVHQIRRLPTTPSSADDIQFFRRIIINRYLQIQQSSRIFPGESEYLKAGPDDKNMYTR